MNPPKILIVDDEPFNIDYLEQELEEANYLTISAANGLEALNRVRSDTPDLVLLDIMMPLMDGFEVLTRLKADPATRHIPVIVISALDNLQSVVRGIHLGAEDYLPKPFEPVLLQARIASSLEKKRLRDLEQQYLQSLERELEIGREIQLGFLPTTLPNLEGWELAAYFKAAKEVAGDFYDAFELADGSLMFLVGDVCGKGVGAALFMTLFRSLMRATAMTDPFQLSAKAEASTPAEHLQRVVSFTNRYVASVHNAASMFATVFIGVVDLPTGHLSYINGGNEPALLRRAGGELEELWPTGPIVGVIPEAQYAVKETLLQPQDVLLAFTDGITDALNPSEEAFGRQRVHELLQLDPGDAFSLVGRLETSLDQFIGTAHQFDDITLFALRKN
ncbi:MAG: SpoIIE family protein phosphatase [Anaerolineales bacterium]|jgi:serine phosphatase RsbU (regulator of sigma subunit)|nr:SpoIIE family protein phosphatase [Anaerolineales bacterium]